MMTSSLQVCKRFRWDYVTEMVEVAILIFGIRLAYVSRNARTHFHVSVNNCQQNVSTVRIVTGA